jgi:hypothetical protein
VPVCPWVFSFQTVGWGQNHPEWPVLPHFRLV